MAPAHCTWMGPLPYWESLWSSAESWTWTVAQRFRTTHSLEWPPALRSWLTVLICLPPDCLQVREDRTVRSLSTAAALPWSHPPPPRVRTSILLEIFPVPAVSGSTLQEPVRHFPVTTLIRGRLQSRQEAWSQARPRH